MRLCRTDALNIYEEILQIFHIYRTALVDRDPACIIYYYYVLYFNYRSVVSHDEGS